jgi:hypothetical protein
MGGPTSRRPPTVRGLRSSHEILAGAARRVIVAVGPCYRPECGAILLAADRIPHLRLCRRDPAGRSHHAAAHPRLALSRASARAPSTSPRARLPRVASPRHTGRDRVSHRSAGARGTPRSRNDFTRRGVRGRQPVGTDAAAHPIAGRNARADPGASRAARQRRPVRAAGSLSTAQAERPERLPCARRDQAGPNDPRTRRLSPEAPTAPIPAVIRWCEWEPLEGRTAAGALRPDRPPRASLAPAR